MRDCIETIGEVIAIHLFAPGELYFSIPFNVQVSSLDDNSVRSSSNDSQLNAMDLLSKSGIAIDTYYNNIPDTSVVMEPGVSINESVKTNVAGNVYTTKISAKTYDMIEDVRSYVNKFSDCEYFDAIVVDTNSNMFIIRGVEPATSITMTASLPLSHQQRLDIEMVSVNGIVPVLRQSS